MDEIHPLNQPGSCCKFNNETKVVSKYNNIEMVLYKHYCTSVCGVPNRAEDGQNRIRGGQTTKIGEIPWQVLFYHFNTI